MAKKGKRRYPASQKVVSEKIAKVKRDDRGLTNKQAVGKALGILRGKKRKGGRRGG